jgi:hypothetical protein
LVSTQNGYIVTKARRATNLGAGTPGAGALEAGGAEVAGGGFSAGGALVTGSDGTTEADGTPTGPVGAAGGLVSVTSASPLHGAVTVTVAVTAL